MRFGVQSVHTFLPHLYTTQSLHVKWSDTSPQFTAMNGLTPPPNFCPHAFHSGAILLYVEDFSKKWLTPYGENNF